MSLVSLQGYIDALTFADPPTLVAAAAWIDEYGIACIQKEMAGILGLVQVTGMKRGDILRKGLATSPYEHQGLVTSKYFYHAHTLMFADEARHYARAIAAVDFGTLDRYVDAVLHELRAGLRALLVDALVLLEHAADAVLGCPGVYGGGPRRVDAAGELFAVAEQATYGRYTASSPSIHGPCFATGVVAIAIEARLRSAFVVHAYDDTVNHRPIPIPVTDLFDAIGRHCPSTAFGADWFDIAKVHRWATYFVGSGRRDFAWAVGYVLQHLRPFLASTPVAKDGRVEHGRVLIPQAEWTAVQQHFVMKAGPGMNFPMADSDDAACTII